MAQARYDVVVIGGGIQGAGVAQAVAAAGHSVLLLEKNAPAAGTSSRSSKLIHGGLRYLESGQFSLVRESLHEREILLKIAPELVHLVPFYIPIYQQTKRRAWQIRAGLSLYSVLGGLGSHTRFSTLRPQDWSRISGLKSEGLQTIFEYRDAQTDDAALTRAVLRSAESLGAEVVFPARFLSATRSSQSYRIEYQRDDQNHECEATVLVNAAGPWANRLRPQIQPAPPHVATDLVQGAHLVLDKRFCDGVIYVEAPSDGRAVFIMPWKDGTLLGTTETEFQGDLDAVQIQPQEENYLLETLNHYLPGNKASVVDSFAGLRVLPSGKASAFGRSRETILLTDHSERVGYVGVYGGKLTAYRATAEKVLHRICRLLPSRRRNADTRTLPLT